MSALAVMHRRAAGFGLIELMISMVLGLLVMGAAIAVFQSNQRTFSANEGQNRVQESARVAYEMMAMDIRAAGGTACSKLARPDEEHVPTSDELGLMITPVTGSASTFTVLSGEDSSYPVTASTTNTVTVKPQAISGWTLSDAFKEGDKLVLCNASLIYVVTVTSGGVNNATNTLTFTPATPVAIYSSVAPPATVSVARFRSANWYLNDGSLFVNRNGVVNEVVSGITALNLSYLQRGDSSYTATPTSWPDVMAVRVNMTLRGQETTGGDVQVDGSNYITRNTSNVVTVRARVP